MESVTDFTLIQQSDVLETYLSQDTKRIEITQINT